ncbi:MAG TPA: hypothetical protein PKV48_08390 [Thermodesulfobacteriota bacterium]|nr:hypothetical protein [Thermodesulfobacteriota bacterium]
MDNYNRVCQLLGKTVDTPDGQGKLVQVFKDQACVLVSGEYRFKNKKYNAQAKYYPLERIFL